MTKAQPDDTNRKNRILVVDDHPVVLEGLAKLINQEPDLAVCGHATEANGAFKVIDTSEPNLAIVDMSLQQGSGLDLVKALKVRYPKLPVLVLSMHEESLYAERALRAGAKGYIMKQEASERLLLAIRRVLNGEIYLSEKMTTRLLSVLARGQANKGSTPVDLLSDRELEVFQLIGHGQGTRQIAEKLHLSIKTIETYREHIKEKLKLDDATELVQHAVQWAQKESGG